MKIDALRQVLAPIRRGASLTCVSRWGLADVVAGVSDLECRDLVVEAGGEFRLHPRLHAKYFRFSESIYVGSTNITARALGFAVNSNLEILCEPAISFDAPKFETELMVGSTEVSNVDMMLWKRLSRSRSLLDTDQHRHDRSTSDWLPSAREPEHVWLAYHGQIGPIVSADERRLAHRDIAALQAPTGMDRESFDLWVAGQLLSSPRVDDVRRVGRLDDVAAWDALSDIWGVTRSEALRARATVDNWIAAILRP